jgi:hypothetical protein
MAFGKFFLLPVIGHAVRLPHLPAEEPAQLRRPAVRGVAGDHLHHLPARQLAAEGRPALAAARGGMFSKQGRRAAVAPLQRRREGGVLGRRVPAGHHRGGSGLVLDKLVPNLVYERQTMQVAHMVHAVATVLMMAVFIGHIYIGTIGMRGAYTAMREGYVDETWAREHHAYWYDDIKAGKIPAQRSKPLAIVRHGRPGRPPEETRHHR